MIFGKPWVVHIYVSLLQGILQVFQDLGGRDDGWDDAWDDVMALWIFSLALINDSGGEFMIESPEILSNQACNVRPPR